MKAKNNRTGEIVEIDEYSPVTYRTYDGTLAKSLIKNFTFIDALKDYYTKLEHQYAGMAMQGMLSSGNLNIIMENSDILPKGIALVSRDFAHALVEKLKEKEEK